MFHLSNKTQFCMESLGTLTKRCNAATGWEKTYHPNIDFHIVLKVKMIFCSDECNKECWTNSWYRPYRSQTYIASWEIFWYDWWRIQFCCKHQLTFLSWNRCRPVYGLSPNMMWVWSEEQEHLLFVHKFFLQVIQRKQDLSLSCGSCWKGCDCIMWCELCWLDFTGATCWFNDFCLSKRPPSFQQPVSTLLSTPGAGEPHDCVALLTGVYSPRPELQDTPLINAEMG